MRLVVCSHTGSGEPVSNQSADQSAVGVVWGGSGGSRGAVWTAVEVEVGGGGGGGGGGSGGSGGSDCKEEREGHNWVRDGFRGKQCIRS